MKWISSAALLPKIGASLLAIMAIGFSANAQNAPKASQKTIIVLPVSVRFESIATEQAYPENRYQGSGLQAEVAGAAMGNIHKAGGRAMLADSVQGFAAALAPIGARLPELFRKSPPADLLDSLAALAKTYGAAGILAFDVLGRVGQDGSLNPFETGWDHATHICRLRAAIFQPSAPQRYWQNDAVGRFLPRPNSKRFAGLTAELFAPLKLP